MSKKLSDMPLDLYSVLQGKKQIISEIDDLQRHGYLLEEILSHLKRMYFNQ